MLVRQILDLKPNHAIETTKPDALVSDVARILSEKGIGALVVSNTGTDVAGIISERDIVRELGRRGTGCLDEPVSGMMTSDVVGCTPGDTAVSVLETMTSKRFRHMPVIDQGNMVGVISIGDVVKARIDEVEHENSALTDMIAGAV